MSNDQNGAVATARFVNWATAHKKDQMIQMMGSPLGSLSFYKNKCDLTSEYLSHLEESIFKNHLLGASPDLLASLEEVTAELSQMHSHYHPACEGGCPTVEYIMNARKAILKANGG